MERRVSDSEAQLALLLEDFSQDLDFAGMGACVANANVCPSAEKRESGETALAWATVGAIAVHEGELDGLKQSAFDDDWSLGA